jgi:hypothetical protein
LSEELTKTNASEIGITTIITARNILLRKALNEGVIYLKFKTYFDSDYSIKLTKSII